MADGYDLLERVSGRHAMAITPDRMTLDEFLTLPNLGGLKAIGGIYMVEIQPAVVAHPGGIHRIVFSGRLPENFVLPSANDGVAPGRATGTNALGFLEEPDTHFESKIATGQSSNWTNIDRV